MKDIIQQIKTLRAFPHGLIAWLVSYAALFPVFHEMFSMWNTPGDRYAHGWLIAAASFYLLALNSKQLTEAPKRFAPVVMLTAVSILGTSWLAVIANITVIQLALLPLAYLAISLAMYGIHNARVFLASGAILYFALPIWNPINTYLQDMSSFMATNLFALSGIPVLVDGNYITLPNGSFHVAEGCSGFKYFISAATIATLYAYLFTSGFVRQIGIIAIGIVLAIVTNWIRIVGVLAMGYELGPQHPMVEDHDTFGWILFAIALGVFFFTAARLSGARQEPPVAAKPSCNWQPPVLSTALLLLPAITVISISLMPYQAEYSLPTADELKNTPRNPTDQWHPNFAGYDDILFSQLPHLSPAVTVDARLYYRIGLNTTFLDYSRNMEPDGWRLLDQQPIALSASVQAIQATVIHVNGRKQLIRYWYSAGTILTTRPLLIKIQRMLNFFRRETGYAVWTISTECEDRDCVRAKRRLDRAVQQYEMQLKPVRLPQPAQ